MSHHRRRLAAVCLASLALSVVAGCSAEGGGDQVVGSTPSAPAPPGPGGSTTDPGDPSETTTTVSPDTQAREQIEARYQDYDRLTVDLRLDDGKDLAEGSAPLEEYGELWSSKAVPARQAAINRLRSIVEESPPLLEGKQTSIVQDVEINADEATVIRCVRVTGTERIESPPSDAQFDDQALITDTWDLDGDQWKLARIGTEDAEEDAAACQDVDYTP